MKTIKQVFLPILASVVIAVIIGVALQNNVGQEYILADIGGIGWLLGVVGTIYTLVAAFTMVEVWNQFNNTSSLISREGKAITSIWNYCDYLNDPKIDRQMLSALVAYLDHAMTVEHKQAAQGMRSVQSSPEILAILHVIDQIKFNDPRDAAIFPLLAQAYEDLSTVRSDRIEASVTRLPGMIKIFFIALSFMLMVSYILVGYVHPPLFIVHTIFGASIISLTYKIILDLDNPFDGYWNLDYSALTQVKAHITQNGRHSTR